jgi:ABC-type cobalamin/Fe3+-siderophores transport system ATPase subunit
MSQQNTICNILIKCNSAEFITQNGIRLSPLDIEIGIGESVFILSDEDNLKNEILHFLAGFSKPVGGNIEYSSNRFKKDICFLKNDMVYPATVYDVVIGGERPGLFNFSKKKEIEARVNCALEKVGIFDCKQRKFSELSTGQKRRVMIAKAIFSQTDTVFLECPTAGLDIMSAKCLNELLSESGKTVIRSCADIRDALEWADKILYCSIDGYFFGTPAEFMSLYA